MDKYDERQTVVSEKTYRELYGNIIDDPNTHEEFIADVESEEKMKSIENEKPIENEK